jgi:Spy/CpxP family protein refolding chaperone
MTAPGGGSGSAAGAVPAAPRPRLLAVMVVVIALLTGILVGVATDRRLIMHGHGGFGAWSGGRFQSSGHGPHGPWGGPGDGGRPGDGPPDRVRQRIASELGLTPAQIAQADSIIGHRMAERRAFEDSIRTRMRGMLDSTRSDIERILTPEQRQKFDAWRSREHRDGD